MAPRKRAVTVSGQHGLQQPTRGSMDSQLEESSSIPIPIPSTCISTPDDRQLPRSTILNGMFDSPSINRSMNSPCLVSSGVHLHDPQHLELTNPLICPNEMSSSLTSTVIQPSQPLVQSLLASIETSLPTPLKPTIPCSSHQESLYTDSNVIVAPTAQTETATQSAPADSTGTSIKNESEDFFRNCPSNLHVSLRTISPGGRDWLDVGRDGPHAGIMLVKPGPSASREPRLVTIIGYVNTSYLARPSSVGSGTASWSLMLVISEVTYKDLFHLVNTGARKVQIGKDGKTNLFVPFRKVDDRYELKLRAKTSYFEAVRVLEIQTELWHERQALNRCARLDGYSNHTDESEDPGSSSRTNFTTLPGSSASQVPESDEFPEPVTDLEDELPDVEPLDWRGAPFPNIYDSTNISTEDSEFIPTSHSSIVPKCLVAVRCFTQFWDFSIDGKQRTGYSLQLESIHLLNYSSDHRTDLIPRNLPKRHRATHVSGERLHRPPTSIASWKRPRIAGPLDRHKVTFKDL